MKKLDLEIKNPTGLHARPAKTFVNLAKQFSSNIAVFHKEKKANGKSLISLLTLGVEKGSKIQIEIDGEDEDLAAAAIQEGVESGLGEEEIIQKVQKESTPVPVPVQEIPQSKQEDGQLVGIAASPGIAVGNVFQYKLPDLVIEDKSLGRKEDEKKRLSDAVSTAKLQLQKLNEQMLTTGATQEAAIFDVHIELLSDQEILESIHKQIELGQSAAKALQHVIDEKAKFLAALPDPVLSGRAADLYDVGYRVLRIMLGQEAEAIQLPDSPVIIFARDLSPSDTVSLDAEKVLGFCTSEGGPTSHTAIIARALGIPAVVGAGEQILAITNDKKVILDGKKGVISVDPSDAAIQQAMAAQQQEVHRQQRMKEIAADPAITKDGHRVEIAANIGGAAEAQKAIQNGAEGVGLLRTEFLFLERTTPPTEAEQQEVYSTILSTMGNLPVIVRTLDVGGDKPIPYIQTPPEENPFLGLRGIRLGLANPEILREQLSALLKSAENGNLHIMFPMISDVGELRQAVQVVSEVKAEISAKTVKVGIMIEVPSAALLADIFAQEVDFFSIGTNDLTQYTLATDRMHGALSKNLDGLHPAVLRLISQTVEGAHKHGKWVGVCGELGSDPLAIPVLVGLGVDELSVSVPAIPEVKAIIREMDYSKSKALAQKSLECSTAMDVRALVQSNLS
jgi:phosphocarrier protein FPr